jgi:glutaredoxin
MNKIILFTLPNCAPCKLLKQHLTYDYISSKLIQVVYLDMDDGNEETLNEATKYGIRSAPTAVCLKETSQVHDETTYDMQLCKTFEQIQEFFNKEHQICS